MKKIFLKISLLLSILFFLWSNIFAMEQKWDQQEIPKLVISEESIEWGRLNEQEELLVMRHVSDVKISKTYYCGYLLDLSDHNLDFRGLTLVLNFLRNKKIPGGNGTIACVAKVVTVILLSKNNLNFLYEDVFAGFKNLELIDLRNNSFKKEEAQSFKQINRPLCLLGEGDSSWQDVFEELIRDYGQRMW